jgi:hypothetical protein
MPRNNTFFSPEVTSSCGFCLGLFFLLCELGGASLFSPVAAAQRSRGTTTTGLQVGRPAGVTATLYRSTDAAYGRLRTTDGDDFMDLYAYRLHERPLPGSLLPLSLGAGVLGFGTN